MANIKNFLVAGLNEFKKENNRMPAEIQISFEQFDILLADFYKFINVNMVGPLVEYKFMGVPLVPTDMQPKYKIKGSR
jgi:hypothetical protein